MDAKLKRNNENTKYYDKEKAVPSRSFSMKYKK